MYMKHKKTIAILLTVAMLFGLMPVSAFATDGSTVVQFKQDGITYQSLSTTGSVMVYHAGSVSGDVTIPSTVTNSDNGITYTVTAIGDNAFDNCTGLTSITIPASVTSIGAQAFYGCEGLTRVTILNSETSIVAGAFDCCSGLCDVDNRKHTFHNGTCLVCRGSLTLELIPFGGLLYRVTSVEDKTVKVSTVADTNTNTNEMIEIPSQITIPSTVPGNSITYAVTAIGDNAFGSYTNVTSITIPASVTSIGESAFAWCEGLTGITIPANVTSIGKSAFYGCIGLTSITIPASVTSIGAQAFYNCTRLTSITIPASVTSIGDYVFTNCTGLTSITIPDSVISIGDYAFYGCTGLTSTTIPASVTSIGAGAFGRCTGLCNGSTHTYYNGKCLVCGSSEGSSDENNDSYTVEKDGWLYSFDDTNRTASVKPSAAMTGTVTIPSTVTYEGSTYTVTAIGDYAFAYCEGLESIIIPDSVTSIGEGAFRWCESLTGITIPNSVISIGQGAFESCLGLCDGDTIHFNYVEKACLVCGLYMLETDEWWYTLDGANHTASVRPRSEMVGTVIIPSEVTYEGSTYTVTAIGEMAFYWSELTGIEIPASVTSIGDYAFAWCEGLTGITIPDGVTSIGKHAFAGCEALTSITLPSSVTSIGDYAFAWSGLTDINIPDCIESIGGYVFADCKALTSITLPSSVTSIDDYAFADWTGLTSITIPDSVTSIGEGAFYNCTGLTSITIPAGVTSIGAYAFSWCEGLTSVTIPDSVTSIGEGAFWYCTGLCDGSNTMHFYNGEKACLVCGLYTVEMDGWWYTFNDTEHIASVRPSDEMDGTVIIPSTVIYEGIPYTVTAIDTSAFQFYQEITGVVIPASIIEIGDGAFQFCEGLTEVIFEDGSSLDYIGEYAFAWTGITTIEMPNSEIYIDATAFIGCEGLCDDSTHSYYNGCCLVCGASQSNSGGSSSSGGSGTSATKADVVSTGTDTTVKAENISAYAWNKAKEAAAQDAGLKVIGNKSNAVQLSGVKDGQTAAVFNEPVSITVPISSTVLQTVTDTGKLTLALVTTDENGNTQLTYVGGTYDADKGTFSAYTDKPGNYVLVEKADLIKIELTIDHPVALVNDEPVVKDVPSRIVDDRTLVPARFVLQHMGCGIDWNGDTRTVIVTLPDGTVLTMAVDEPIPGFGAAPIIEDGRTLVPVAYIAYAMDAHVLWVEDERKVIIVK